MKKQILHIVLLFALCLPSSFVKAKTIKVSPSEMALHKAINKAKANDTLIVEGGVYKEHDIVIQKRLTLIGKNYPIVDGEGKYRLFLINADSVTIEGFQVQNTGHSSMEDIAAIKVIRSKYVLIQHNKLLNNTYAVYIQDSHYCTVSNNVIHSNTQDEISGGNGIHAWQSNHLLIQNNNISGQRDGIYFEFVTESQIINNTSSNNLRYGLHFMFSHHDTYTSNLFSDNGSGVAVMYSKFVVMRQNTFKHNWGDASYGLLLKEIADGSIENNHFISNTIGLFMDGTTRIYTKNNVFENNGWAMRVQANCNSDTIIENNFISNSFDVATNGTLVLNSFEKNYWDKYDGYDLDRNHVGDVPYYPVSVYSVVSEKVPTAMILYRSLLTDIMDKVEKVMPSIIPDHLKDNSPMMKKWNL